MVKHDKKGLPILRLYHRKKIGIKDPRYLIKCNDCSSKLEIYYNRESLEINGVLASKEEWKKALLPLLK